MTLEEEIEMAVEAYIIKKAFIPEACKRDELKHILFYNLIFNRTAKYNISEKINWREVKFDLATTAMECLAAYALVYARYEPLGFNDLTLIDNTDNKLPASVKCIPGLTYDDYDKRSITVVIKDKDHLNGTLRLISGDGCLLPTETLFDKQKGLEHIRDQQNIKGKTISEISKLALSKDANPTIHYRTLVASKNILAKPLNIGNEISIVPKSEYEKRYNRIGFVAELTKRFYHELKEPDVICSWDQDTQLTPYYKNIVLKETGNKVSRRKNTSSSINDFGSIPNTKRSGRH